MKKHCNQILKEMSSFLIRCFALQLQEKQKAERILEEEMIAQMYDFSSYFIVSVEMPNGDVFKFLTEDEVAEVLDEIPFFSHFQKCISLL